MSKIPTIYFQPSIYKAGKLMCALPTNGDADLVFTRAGEASRINQLGEQEIMATGVPCLDYSDGDCPSAPLRPSRKNLFFNSETGVTQTITVVSGVNYAVSFSGTGSIAFSGGATGTLNGTGANAVDRVSSIVTTSSTSVTCTVSGTVEYVNFEINPDNSSVSYATSWIETTGTIATRILENFSKTGLSSYINSSEGVFYIEAKTLSNDSAEKSIALSDGTTANRINIRFTNDIIKVLIIVDNVIVFNVSETVADITSSNRIALKYKEDDFALWINNVEVGIDNSGVIFSANTLNKLSSDFGTPSSFFNGEIKDLRVYNQILSDAELETLTTL